MNEFRNIHKNTYIEYDYQTYKNLVLDRINKKDSNDGIIKEIGKNLSKCNRTRYKRIQNDKN